MVEDRSAEERTVAVVGLPTGLAHLTSRLAMRCQILKHTRHAQSRNQAGGSSTRPLKLRSPVNLSGPS